MSAVMMIADSRLSAEMWISLRALLASHTAMYSIARPKDALTITTEDAHSISVIATRGTLHWTAPDALGTGTWQLTFQHAIQKNDRGRFEFTDEGFLRFDGAAETLELEAAVEHQLRKLQG